MTTYPIRDQAGRTFAFEVENAPLTRSRLVTLLRSVDGVSEIWRRSLFRRPVDVHLRFQYRGVPFVVWEPYADSSRYWIGPDDHVRERPDIGDLQAAFDRYIPPFVLRVLGYLLSLRFLFPGRPD